MHTKSVSASMNQSSTKCKESLSRHSVINTRVGRVLIIIQQTQKVFLPVIPAGEKLQCNPSCVGAQYRIELQVTIITISTKDKT